MPTEKMILLAAKTAHEVNRAYCHAIGDDSIKPWDEAPDWQRNSSVEGMRFHIENPLATPEDSHNNWLRSKSRDGWKYGLIKDPERREHPAFLPYDQLPLAQRIKDHLFKAVARTVLELG